MGDRRSEIDRQTVRDKDAHGATNTRDDSSSRIEKEMCNFLGNERNNDAILYGNETNGVKGRRTANITFRAAMKELETNIGVGRGPSGPSVHLAAEK